MSTANDHAGLAALSICEALLLAMNDRGLLPENEIVGVLQDAAASHANAVGTALETETASDTKALSWITRYLNSSGTFSSLNTVSMIGK
jgi:hypothetical protein